jgi:acyl-CoA synthetase (AMP-forming)/AMP-acid ligase II
LNLLPLCVLLENIAGVYVPLITGATCICPPLSEAGVSGASGFDAERCLDAIARHAPDSVILLPQMLRALLAQLARQRATDRRIRSLKFVAIGGAKTPPQLIGQARELGLPVYEGYGLSECASVVAVNVPGADRVGSVGRPLPGTRMRLADDGEIELSGRGFSGYLGAPAVGRDAWLKTGDLGSIDRDGYVYVTGRKDNLLITGYGRNVSPEWPESLLLASPIVSQAAVFGEGRPHLVAVLAPSARDVPDAALDTAVAQANQQLPVYARIGAWVRAAEPFAPGNGLATANGRVRRQGVWERYGEALNQLYGKERNPS